MTEKTALAEVYPTAMEVAAEVVVSTSASATALGGQAPTGVGPPIPLRATLPGDGQHGHHDATRSNATTQPTPSLTQHQQRRESQQVEQHCTPAKGGGNAATTSVGPHLVPTARPMPTLHPMAIFQPILSKVLIPNNHPTPLHVAIVRQSFVRINMRTNQCPFHSTPFHRRPIPIQSILGIPQVTTDHLLQTQYKLRRRSQICRNN